MKKALAIFYILSGVTSLAFQLVFTVSLLYFVTVAKLNPLQMVLIGTALELGVFLFEIPTGIVADVYSRRLSVIIGMFVISLGFVLEGLFPAFGPLLASQLVWGIGYTFTSGATQAWISDEIGERAANRAFMRAAQIDQVSGLVGVGVGTLLGNLYITVPILTSGGIFALLGLALILVMPEDGFHPTPPENRNTWQHMGDTLKRGIGMVRLRPALAGILAIGLLFGIYSEGFDRLWTPFLLERFTLPAWFGMTRVTFFGLLAAVIRLLTAGASGLLIRRVDLGQTRQVAWGMAACSAALVACLFAFPLSRAVLFAIVMLVLIGVLRALIEPLYTAWVNHRLDPQVRATVLSMSSQVDALGQIGGGPLVGVLAQQFGLPVGLLSSAALLAPVLLLIGWQVRKEQ